MKLNEIYLQELQGSVKSDVYTFIYPKWDGHEVDEIMVDPFDVLVKYHAHSESADTQPEIQILSVVANEPVHMTSELGPSIDKLQELEDIHALVIGERSVSQAKLKTIMPDAIILDGRKIEKGTKGALQLFSYFDDHKDDHIIVEANGTGLLDDIHCVVIFKALLDDGLVSYRTAGYEREFQFTGRIVLLADDLESVNDALEHRCAVIDLSKDKTYPRGTALQEIPGWSDADENFFQKEAIKNFSGHSE